MRDISVSPERERVKTVIFAAKHKPFPARRPEKCEVRFSVAGEIGRREPVGRRTELRRRGIVIRASMPPPFSDRRTEDRDVRLTVAIEIERCAARARVSDLDLYDALAHRTRPEIAFLVEF